MTDQEINRSLAEAFGFAGIQDFCNNPLDVFACGSVGLIAQMEARGWLFQVRQSQALTKTPDNKFHAMFIHPISFHSEAVFGATPMQALAKAALAALQSEKEETP